MKPFAILSSLVVILTLVFSGCSQTKNPEEEADSSNTQFTEVTQQQFEATGMKTGTLMNIVFNETITCNGYINAPANGKAQVSSSLGGIIENIRFRPGEKVQKGSVLCRVSSQELIVLQQNYVQSIAEFKQAESEYKRSKALFKENIGSEKNLINKESYYKSILAQKQSLALQLKRLNLNLNEIEKGNFYESFPVIAPISGYITKQEAVLGQFINQEQALVEIVNTNQLQLELAVFEKDFAKLKTGQKVIYKTLGEQSTNYEATLVSIGKSINQASKNIQCIAKINESEKRNLINRSFVEAKIIVNQKESSGLPKEALLKSGNEYFVFVVAKKEQGVYYLSKQKVSIGKTSDGFIEILSPKDIKNIVIKGTYNL